MQRTLAGVLGIVVMVLAVAVFHAVAAETAAKPATETKAVETKATETTAANAPESQATPEERMARYEEHMKSSGASEGTLMRYRQMQMAKFSIDEPIGLLALKDQLKLTPEQVKKIEGAADMARKEAKAALTKEQTDMIDKMKDTPDTAMGLSAQTRRMGGSRRGGGGGGGGTGGDRPAGGAAGE